jgi:hypothetical protein
MENTPAEITEAVSAFCRSIREDHEAEYVPVHTLADAEHRDCYGNVAKKIEISGGSLLYGWAVWLERGKFIEAEHHAVWVAPDGHKECVSCHTHTDRILFVADPENAFKNDFIPNRRRALTDDHRLVKWLGLAEEHDRLKAKYAVRENCVLQGFQVNAPEVERVQTEMVMLQMEMGMVPSMQDMAAELSGIFVCEEKPRATLTPTQPAAMLPTKPKAHNPKQRAEVRNKERKREKRRAGK